MSLQPAVAPLLDRLAMGPPLVCGVVNVTPDSFSDGGRYADASAAVRQARRLAEEGADLLDIGGESTRPGAVRPSVGEELDRVVPVIEALAADGAVPLSVDTSRPEVMAAAIAAGAAMVNDVRGLEAPGAVETAARAQAVVCISHMRGEPGTMQDAPAYADVVGDVARYLGSRARDCLRAGLSRRQIVLDPGFGFGKNLEHNLSLLVELERCGVDGLPVMAGLSRKSMLGAITGRPTHQRLAASIAAGMVALSAGARILRVHDVAETVDAVRVWQAAEDARASAAMRPLPFGVRRDAAMTG